MSEIIDIRAREILDSRGNPTIEADVLTDDGAIVAQSRHPERRPVRARHSNCVMATSRGSSARGF